MSGMRNRGGVFTMAPVSSRKAMPWTSCSRRTPCVGNACMVNPSFAGGPPTMFICGNDAAAKHQVTELLDVFGWLTEDMGTVHAARAIEPLCQLWCIPGLTGRGWTHAFKLLHA